MTEENTSTETSSSASLLNAEAAPALDFSAGRPETFPEEYWDAEKNTPIVDKLFNDLTQQKKRAEGLRVKLSKGEFEGKAPDDIKEYTLELDEKLKPLVPDDDPLMEAARLSAKEAGLPKEAFSKFITPIISKLAELKASQEEANTLTAEDIAEAKSAELAKLGASGVRIAKAVGGFVDELESTGLFSKQEADAIRNMATTAEAVSALNKLRTRAGGHDEIPIDMPITEHASRVDIQTKAAAALVAGNEAEYNKYSAMLNN